MRAVFTFLIGSILVILAGTLIAGEQDRREFEAAKAEYEQSSHDEAARATYVTKLAQIADRLVSEYRQSGQRNQLGIAKAPGSERHRFQEAEAIAGWQVGVAASHLRVSRERKVRNRRGSDRRQLANPREPTNPGRLERADHFAEPGLLHLLEPRFRILPLTGKRVKTGHLHAITARQ